MAREESAPQAEAEDVGEGDLSGQPGIRDPYLQELRLRRAAAFRAAASALAREPRPMPVRLVPVGDHGYVRVQPDPSLPDEAEPV
jgi:hypothetical protein